MKEICRGLEVREESEERPCVTRCIGAEMGKHISQTTHSVPLHVNQVVVSPRSCPCSSKLVAMGLKEAFEPLALAHDGFVGEVSSPLGSLRLGGSGPSSAIKRPTSSTDEVRVPQGLFPNLCSLSKAQSLEVGSPSTDTTLLVEVDSFSVGYDGKFSSLELGVGRKPST